MTNDASDISAASTGVAEAVEAFEKRVRVAYKPTTVHIDVNDDGVSVRLGFEGFTTFADAIERTTEVAETIREDGASHVHLNIIYTGDPTDSETLRPRSNINARFGPADDNDTPMEAF